MENFKTTHDLLFEVAESPYRIGSDQDHKMFRVGTCEGQWGDTGDSYYILSVVNTQEGNGHMDDVFEWFEYSCKRDQKNLLVLVIMNDGFRDKLLTKRGFIKLDAEGENVIKVFNKKSYKKLVRKGNSIIRKGTLKCM